MAAPYDLTPQDVRDRVRLQDQYAIAQARLLRLALYFVAACLVGFLVA